MQRSELAALLAATHRTTSKRTDQHQHSRAASLSPQQAFQSRVRNLSDDNHASPPPKSRLRQTSNRVSQAKSSSKITKRRANQQNDVQNNDLSLPSVEPNFGLEERAVWKRREHDETIQHDNDFILIPPSNETSDSEQTDLAPFRPLKDDPAQRPKTSRGQSAPSVPQVSQTPVRPSKFVEGSMNNRSVGISSTWEVHGDRLSLDQPSEDSDATLKAYRPSIDTITSTDLSEFQPESAAPATLKQRLSRFASTFKSIDETSKEPAEQKSPKRRKLRKSISTWGFNKFFGASTDSSAEDTPVEALNERKRKAEQAYEQQFGTKKQKANDGLTVEDNNRTIRASTRTLRKRPEPTQRTVRQRTATPVTQRRYNASTNTILSPSDSADLSEADVDRRKRTSRKELEKENHQLRALLREQQAQSRGNLQLAASQSSSHLPLDGVTTASQAQQPRPRKVLRGHLLPNMPPVPPLPERAVLSNMANRNIEIFSLGEATSWKDTGTVKRVGQKSAMRDAGGSENTDPVKSNEDWKWPDDVF